MAFKLIEGIKVNNRPGKIFDRYIYSCNVNIGFSESPSTIVLNGVSEEGFQITDPPNLALDKNFTIQIGSKIYRQMSLFSAEENYEAGKNITTYTFIDPSFILDKIYVGLLDRHKADIGTSKNFDISFPIACEQCQGETVNTIATNNSISTTRTSSIGVFYRYNVDTKRILRTANEVNVTANGGNIILGTEEFTLAPCDISDITYNFSDLITALKKDSIQNTITINLPADKNPNYRQSYTGTLREVLSSWCVDFGYTFYFDISDNTLKFIDLSSPIANTTINQIKTILTKNKGKYTQDSLDVPPYILSYGVKKTLENTYDQNHISLYKKPAKTKPSSSSYFFPASFSSATLANIIGSSDKYDRTREEAYKAIAITKYFKNLRWAFHYLETDNLQPCGTNYITGPSVGGSDFSQVLFDLIEGDYSPFGEEIFQSIKNHWSSGQLSYYFVQYDPDTENLITNWEESIGNDFLGKSYYKSLFDLPQDFSFCSSNIRGDIKISSDPSTEVIKDGVYPHAYLIKDNYTSLPNSARVFQRSNATWDVDEIAIKNFETSIANDFGRYKPEYYALDDKIIGMFKDAALALYGNSGVTLSNFFEGLKGKKINIMAAPKRNDLSTELNFTDLRSNAINSKESVYGSSSTGGGSNDDCKLKCETNPIDSYCPKCNYGDEVRPSTGLVNRNSKKYSITITPKNQSATKFDFIYPSESDYYAYIMVDKNFDYTTPKVIKVLGDLNENLNQNTMSINVVSSDITSDIDAYLDPNGNSIIEAPYPIGIGGNLDFQSLTPESYHNYIHNRISYSISSPNEIISCRIVGLDFGELVDYLSPGKGLTNIQISSNENGIFTDLEFSTRPKTLPKQETLLRNSFIKSNTLNSIKFNTYR